ncbi:hypothetical protein QBC35DRAFT_457242 [Podospora australis]|uniref:Uncharacterized protein n=1 Tax=Podospora australis TaxID=1536484 RepID=A0AAN7AE43_9PEZI|nr:hypothetical protein QBC35DRAFT_457242 [Podospora australis]
MQLTSIVVLAISMVATPAMADCFGSGPTWNGYQATALQSLTKFCREDWNRVMYARERRTKCRNLTNNLKANFEVEYLGHGNPTVLAESECILRLSNEVNGCGRGGESVIGDFKFTHLRMCTKLADYRAGFDIAGWIASL